MDQLCSLLKKIVRIVQLTLKNMNPRQKGISGNGVINSSNEMGVTKSG